jgi:alpha-D-ribose 1-methylphosphonate 5-triphosphate synthase subunit PhnL
MSSSGLLLLDGVTGAGKSSILRELVGSFSPSKLSLRTDHPGGDRLVDALCTADRGRRRPDVNNM